MEYLSNFMRERPFEFVFPGPGKKGSNVGWHHITVSEIPWIPPSVQPNGFVVRIPVAAYL